MSILPGTTKPLSERIKKALEDFTDGRASMHIPVQETDVDVVLHDCRNRIEELEKTEQRLVQAEDALHLVLNTDPVNGTHVRVAKKYFDEKAKT